jgi:hypothetical protein
VHARGKNSNNDLAENESCPLRCRRPAIPAALGSTRRDLILETLLLSRADSVRSRDPPGIKRAALTCAFVAEKTDRSIPNREPARDRTRAAIAVAIESVMSNE